ncbi:hypothetical protein [Snodgrassella alvi]|nr:hypothetical protein [Snodgrassella alvi]
MSNDKNKMDNDHASKTTAPSSVKSHVLKSPAPVPTNSSQNGGTDKK